MQVLLGQRADGVVQILQLGQFLKVQPLVRVTLSLKQGNIGRTGEPECLCCVMVSDFITPQCSSVSRGGGEKKKQKNKQKTKIATNLLKLSLSTSFSSFFRVFESWIPFCNSVTDSPNSLPYNERERGGLVSRKKRKKKERKTTRPSLRCSLAWTAPWPPYRHHPGPGQPHESH